MQYFNRFPSCETTTLSATGIALPLKGGVGPYETFRNNCQGHGTHTVGKLMSVAKPENKLRVCLDLQSLNMTILRLHYPSRNFDDILPELSKMKYFTKLDARSGDRAIKLSHASSLLTTFNAPFKPYLRLPFGLNSSQ